jgi:RNA polymerase sigma-54 factor
MFRGLMALEIRQVQKLQQQLVITVQLQQAIKLLQLSHQELITAVEKEMLENPALEEIPGTEGGTVTDAEASLQADANAERQDVIEQNNGAQEEKGMDWAKVLEDMASQPRNQGSTIRSTLDELPPIEATLTKSADLAEHLTWQLNMQSCTEDEYTASVAIIHNLDHRGWLDGDIPQIMNETGMDQDSVEGALMIIQGFEPHGCGARGLVECLVIQARLAWPEDPFIVPLLENHIGDLETRNYANIARGMELHQEDVVEYHRMIQTLEPWPGRPFSDAPEQYIIPDIQVVRIGDKWQILQNEDGLPRLRVSGYYRKILTDGSASKTDRDYIKERLDSADFLIKSIFKRQRTIHKVMQCILVRQKEFFDHGTERLKPMVLREVADEIEVHESTVSRVTTNKYVQCPHGIFELKYFFNAGIQRVHGEDLAAEAVKQKIRKLISEENIKKPLSDQKIVTLLLHQNVKIARRTVAKYREAMGFLSSSQRKNIL